MLVVDPASAKECYPDMEVFGDPKTWICIAKASVPGEWVKSTKAMRIYGLGVLVQVTTEFYDRDRRLSVSEALSFIPGASILQNPEGNLGIGYVEGGA